MQLKTDDMYATGEALHICNTNSWGGCKKERMWMLIGYYYTPRSITQLLRTTTNYLITRKQLAINK